MGKTGLPHRKREGILIRLKNYISDLKYGNKTTAAFRILLGILFIHAGIFKVIDLNTFGRIIIKYNILPTELVPYIAIILPVLELNVGILLFLGYRIKDSSLISIILMIGFIISISINILRGESFNCGCFELSRFGITEEIGLAVIFRDIIILLAFAIIFTAKKHYYSIDSIIEQEDLSHL